jgi:hypothetical protein
MATKLSLVGLYYINDHGDHYHVGRVLAVISDRFVLIQDDGDMLMPMHTLDIDELSCRLDDGRPMWYLFRTRAAMDSVFRVAAARSTGRKICHRIAVQQ